MRHTGFDGKPHTGELVVNKRWAEDLVGVFRTLYEARWPIAQMRLVDDYGGDDDASMAANNTSAFNCRTVAGSSNWSAHAYGNAIDLNPVQNPYLTGREARPPVAALLAHVHRGPLAEVPDGTIKADDVVVRAFAAIGWSWGGAWSTDKDFQHFSAPS